MRTRLAAGLAGLGLLAGCGPAYGDGYGEVVVHHHIVTHHIVHHVIVHARRRR